MKKVVACLAVAGAMIAMSSSGSEAAFCRARSSWGSSGWGRSVNMAQASGIALAECAVRTPRGYRCYLTGCSY